MKTYKLVAVVALCLFAGQVIAADKIKLRLSTSTSEADLRAVGLATIFAEGVSEFAQYEHHWDCSNGAWVAFVTPSGFPPRHPTFWHHPKGGLLIERRTARELGCGLHNSSMSLQLHLQIEGGD